MTVEDLSRRMKQRRAKTGDWRDGLIKTGDGVMRKNLHNACVALQGAPRAGRQAGLR